MSERMSKEEIEEGLEIIDKWLKKNCPITDEELEDNEFIAKDLEIERLCNALNEVIERNSKAIEYIEENIKGNYFRRYDDEIYRYCDDLLEILKGSDKE